METGPNYIPSLFDTLVKFRSYPIALCADIEKAFLQIEIKPEDRDKLQFLWIDDPSGYPGSNSSSSPRETQEIRPRSVRVLQDLYVDDLPGGADDEEKAFEIYESTKRVMKCGGFNLLKWKSNSKSLTDRIEKCEASTQNEIQANEAIM